MASSSLASSAYSPAPHLAALEIPEYPQFERTAVPLGTGAVSAWKGVIQPFADDDSAQRFLGCLEQRVPVEIVEGRINSPAANAQRHWANPWLVQMQAKFLLLILEFDGTEHPRAYSLQPEISNSSHPLHPHLRHDKMIKVGRQELPALCIYSGAEFHYSPTLPRIVQFLDQLSTYMGRHLIWMRTRVEIPPTQGGRVQLPKPGEHVFELHKRIQTCSVASIKPHNLRLYQGYWPGAVARSGASDHLRTIPPTQECWCCSGKPYGQCHRALEQRIVAEHEQVVRPKRR